MQDSPVHDLSGTVLGGYQIQRVLGRGGMATVYAAYQLTLQREIAIKVVHQNFTGSDPMFFARFEREALTTAKLSHPFILPVFDYGQDRGYIYLTMPAMTESLREYMRDRRRLPLLDVVRILDQIASALDYAHQNQVIHRDLKPSNILLDDHHDCRLSDFGIAHLMSDRVSLTATGALLGTPAYMSPEQWNGSAVGTASDLYSLGVLLYELVGGQLPFQAKSVAAMMTMHISATPKPIARKDLPDSAMAVILKALAKAPNARYPSAFELASAFSTAVRNPRFEASRPLLTSGEALVATDISTIQMAEPQTLMLVDNAPLAVCISEQHLPAEGHRLLSTAMRRRGLISLAILLLLAAGWLVYNRSQPTARDAQKLNEAGLAALSGLDYVNAVNYFKEALRIDPSNASVYFNLGVAEEEQSVLTEAQVDYQNALRIDGLLLPAHYRLAELLLDQGQIAAGFETADEGIRILQAGNLNLDNNMRDMMQFDLYAARGHAYLLRNTADDLTLANADFQQALAVKGAVPYPAPVYYYLAQLYHLQGKTDAESAAWLNVIRYADPLSTRENKWIVQANAARATPGVSN